MSANPLIFDPMLAHLKRASIGDKKAAIALVQAISPKLFAVAYRLLRNKALAEEAVQETLLRLWRIAPNWRAGNAKIETWAFRVVSNLCFDSLKRSGRFVADALDENSEIIGDFVNPETYLERDEIKNRVDMALETLPTRQKLAIIYTYFENLGAKETANILETSVEAIESLLSRAKRNLKQYFETNDGDILNQLIGSEAI